MLYGSLIYRNNINLGDQIQSLAAEQFLPGIDRFFDRDTLSLEKADTPYLIIMQGWFSMTPELCFPPPDNIIPVFFGFHISAHNNGYQHFLNDATVNYFNNHEPIGCRDRSTLDLMQQKGVRSFLSLCLTLTFPARHNKPKNGKVILVDAKNINLPDQITKDAVSVSHILKVSGLSEETKRKMAAELLTLYRDEARLVVTTRLHCALPCIAMGIPVIFFRRKDDVRLSILDEVDLPVYDLDTSGKHINWSPEPVEIQDLKNYMVKALHSQMEFSSHPLKSTFI